MATQIETGSGSARATSYHDLLDKQLQFLCSQHVATVAVNAAGTGYTVGDLLTLTHASAHLDAVFEVTSISGGGGTGPITGLRIYSSGAFAQQAVSATISAGGTGYAVGDVIQVDGGSSRLPAKFEVTTVSSGAVTAVSLYEGGGAYSSTPSNPAATTQTGRSITSSGTNTANDDCTLTVTYQAIVGTTGLSVTGGTGSSATVDITLAETGWSVDERSENDITINSLDYERIVVLKGDATGLTNKPFIAFGTGTSTSGLTTRYWLSVMGLIAHNPALPFESQDFRSPNYTAANTYGDGGAYLLLSEDTGSGVDEMDFWFFADDQHAFSVVQILESAAISDDGIYMQMHAGLMNRIGTETEDPYPMMIFASSRQRNIPNNAGHVSITGIAEQRHASSGPGWFYNSLTGAWTQLQNDDTNNTPGVEENLMLPVGRPRLNDDIDQVVADGTLQIQTDFFELDRTSATLILRKIPGTVDEFFLWPLTIMKKDSINTDPVNDKLHGQVKDIFWISSDDGTGNRIVNFSEDYVTVGGDRYLIFHNHVHVEPYQYIAVKWDV